MSFLENVWAFLILIGIMIMIHELGHYWAARYFDVRVEAFSFGFGPRLFGWRRGETDFRVSAILFGGYVKMAGEQPGDVADDPRSFLAKPRWQRMIIAFAGPFVNIVLAVGILTGLYMVKFPKLNSTGNGTVGVVTANSVAAKAGVREGDRVVEFDGKRSPAWEEIWEKEITGAGQPIPVTLLRDGAEVKLTITPEIDPKLGVGSIGWAEQSDVLISRVEPGLDAQRQGLRKGDKIVSANGQPIRSAYRLSQVVRASKGSPVEVTYEREGQQATLTLTPAEKEYDGQKLWMIGVLLEPRVEFIKLGFVDALRESVDTNVKSATMIFTFIERMIEGRMSPKSLEGPIRIAQMAGDAIRRGPDDYLGLMAAVSLNLAVFNLLPIPILDGGVILLLLIESLFRRDLSMSVKENVMKFGFVFLMCVVVFVLYNDIAKILPKT
ncbi:MAG: RIP metalloprotease RseP [Acidobacteria bacterium]|nr:RIP metalloprotease RseP [Acidobacteriota bacterium]